MTEPRRDTEPVLDREQAGRLALSLSQLVEAARSALPSRADGSATVRALGEHLGVHYDQAILVASEIPVWQQVSAHRAITHHLEQASPGAEWFGVAVSGMHRQHSDLLGLLHQDAEAGRDQLTPPDYTSAPTGPDTTEEVIDFGLVRTVAPSGGPAVVALRTTQYHGPPALGIEVLAASRQDAAALVDHLRALVDEFDVIRGQVVSFSTSEHFGNQLVSFLPRPHIPAESVVLPEGILDGIESHVVGPAGRTERLKDLGIHLKRGLLLHGPPGTGKTHTVRYLMGRLAGCTVIVLSGTSLRFIDQAAAIARRLAPSVVVVEDVDLIAMDRSFSVTGNPLLFTLLDAMDGVASDADVTFVLTTNRAADLEAALVERPGRIDLAVEIPRPDADGRLRLFELYRGAAALTGDLGPAIEATEGATASAIKELVRRAVLAALDEDPDADPPVVTDAVLARVLADFTSERESLSRSLLGGAVAEGQDDGGFGPEGPGWRAGPGVAPGAGMTIASSARRQFSRGWTTYRPR